jgi:hypothetical protein
LDRVVQEKKKQHRLSPSVIFNMEESGFSTVPSQTAWRSLKADFVEILVSCYILTSTLVKAEMIHILCLVNKFNKITLCALGI